MNRWTGCEVTSLWLLAGRESVLGLTLQPTEGAVVSFLIVSKAVVELPASSLTEQLMVWVPSPKALAVQVPAAGNGHLAYRHNARQP